MSNSRQIASLPNILTLIDDAGGQFIKQQAAATTTSYTITWPAAVGGSGRLLGTTDGSGTLGWLNSVSVALSGGTVDNSVIGGSTPAAITGTTITANSAFVGPLTGNATTATALATGRTFSFTGDATGTSGAFTGAANASTALTLAASGVSAGSYGSTTAIPVITIDAKGRITSASTASISSSLTIAADSGSNDTVGVGSDTLTFAGTSNEVETTVSNNQIQIGLPSTVSGLTTVSATNLQGALAGSIASATTATTQAASDSSTKVATTAYVTTAVSNLVDSAPGALNTLNELAAALGDDASFSTTVTNSLAGKLALAGGTMTGDLILGDNVKLEIGSATGGDLQIYHDGSHSYIDDAGTGNLFIRSGTLTISNLAGNKSSAVFSSAGAQTFYYDNTVRFQTTTTGAYVNGRLEVATIESSANKGVAFGSHILPTSSASTTDDTVDLGSSSYRFRAIYGRLLYGTISTAAQPNITSVGTLSSLAVSGNITGTIATASQTGITAVGTLSSLNVSGTVTANAFAGTLSTAAQTNITSVGTLSALAVSGDVTIDTSTLKVDTSNNRVGILNASPDVTLDIGSATDSIHIPVGTTAQRPSSPAAGYFRYNSSLSQFEGYTSAWGAIGGGGTNTFNHNVFTGDGSTTAFALAATTESENNLLVFIDGVFQEQGAYSIATSGGTTTLTMSAAPASGRKLVVYQVSAGVSGSNLNIDTMTGDGSDTTLTLSIAPVNENNTQVFFDGVYQNKSTYSISGTTLTFSTAPPTGVAVEVMTFTQTEVNVPVNDTVDTVHLKAGAVTAAKIESSLDLSSKSLTLPAVAVPSASTATTQSASDNTTKIATTAYVTTAIANLIDGAPGTLNTLNELAAALADDASFSSTITTSLAAKANLAAPNFTGNVTFDSTTLTVDATNNRVGIGTASPGRQLTVSTSGAALFSLVSTGDDNCQVMFGDSASDTVGKVVYDHGTNHMRFETNASEAMRINSSGSLLVGKTASGIGNTGLEVFSTGQTYITRAGGPLALNNTSGVGGQIYLYAGGTYTANISTVSGGISFGTGAGGSVTDNRVVIDSSGNLGIGETDNSGYLAPDLVVVAKAQNGGITIKSSSTSHAGTLAFGDTTAGNATYDGYIQYEHNNRALTLATAGTERIRINSSGNVGIGTSSPGYKLDVQGSGGDTAIFRGDANNTIRAYLGSGYQIFQAYNGTNTNQFGYFSDAFYIQTAGTERIRINSSGNVGIGTSSPDLGSGWNRILHVHGASGAGAHIRLTDNHNGASGDTGFFLGQYQDDTYVINREPGTMRFFTSNAERMRLLSNGFMTLGDRVADGAVQGGVLSITQVSGSSSMTMFSRSGTATHNGQLYFQSTTSTSGNYTATAAGRHLGLLGFRGVDSAGVAREGAGIFVTQSGSAVSGKVNGDMFFRTADSNRMQIMSNGEIRTGSLIERQTMAKLNARQNGACIEFGHGNRTAGYFGTLGVLHANGSPYIGFSTAAEESGNTFATFGHPGIIITNNLTAGLSFRTVGTASATGQTPLQIMRITSGGNIMFDQGDRINFYGSNFYVLNDQNAGVRLIDGNTSWTTQSDERTKENITDIGSVLSKIKDYRCVEYNLKSQDKKMYGFIAQDWETDFPHLVDEDDNFTVQSDGSTKPADEEGNTSTDAVKTLSYNETIPVLLKAIQEQQALIEALQTKVAALEGE